MLSGSSWLWSCRDRAWTWLVRCVATPAAIASSPTLGRCRTRGRERTPRRAGGHLPGSAVIRQREAADVKNRECRGAAARAASVPASCDTRRIDSSSSGRGGWPAQKIRTMSIERRKARLRIPISPETSRRRPRRSRRAGTRDSRDARRRRAATARRTARAKTTTSGRARSSSGSEKPRSRSSGAAAGRCARRRATTISYQPMRPA